MVQEKNPSNIYDELADASQNDSLHKQSRHYVLKDEHSSELNLWRNLCIYPIRHYSCIALDRV